MSVLVRLTRQQLSSPVPCCKMVSTWQGRAWLPSFPDFNWSGTELCSTAFGLSSELPLYCCVAQYNAFADMDVLKLLGGVLSAHTAAC